MDSNEKAAIRAVMAEMREKFGPDSFVKMCAVAMVDDAHAAEDAGEPWDGDSVLMWWEGLAESVAEYTE